MEYNVFSEEMLLEVISFGYCVVVVDNKENGYVTILFSIVTR